MSKLKLTANGEQYITHTQDIIMELDSVNMIHFKGVDLTEVIESGFTTESVLIIEFEIKGIEIETAGIILEYKKLGSAIYGGIRSSGLIKITGIK